VIAQQARLLDMWERIEIAAAERKWSRMFRKSARFLVDEHIDPDLAVAFVP
jgi:hypothetical protein